MTTIPSELLNTVHHADCFDLLARIPDGSIDLIATDPPYNGVKDVEWDNQWKTDADYLDWIKRLLAEFKRVLKPNGSLYLFASPRMAARVEVATGDYFNVINQIRWVKQNGWHKKTDEEILRGYLQPWEAVIFAEQYESDARYNSVDYALWGMVADGLRNKLRAKTLHKSEQLIDVYATDGRYSTPASIRVNAARQLGWLPVELELMTAQVFERVNEIAPLGVSYDDLRREYEDLRREYEDLRRPFNASEYRPYTDVWEFRTVNTYEGKHPCEKPYAMMEHIILTSSRPGDVVLDVFAGSGVTGDAASRNGRDYILCDADSHWANYANRRLAMPYTLPMMFGE